MSDDRMARTQPEATDALENADANGEQTEQVLRGDESVVTARRAEGTANSRARAAVQAALDKIQPVRASEPVPRAALQKDREAVAARGGIGEKTAGKVATDEHTWEQYVEEQGLEIGEYPSKEQVVEFAVWLTRRRERACLAQRPDSGPKLTGLVKRTIHNMLAELFTHAHGRPYRA